MGIHIPFPERVSKGAFVNLRGGDIARYEGRCELTGKHRCTTYKDVQGNPVHPKAAANRNDVGYTVWLLSDDGRCRGDRKDSPHDYAGTAA